jgi:ABC-type sugar transport system ATPase subunit
VERELVALLGDIEQVGSPLDLRDRPHNAFGAGFTGL